MRSARAATTASVAAASDRRTSAHKPLTDIFRCSYTDNFRWRLTPKGRKAIGSHGDGMRSGKRAG